MKWLTVEITWHGTLKHQVTELIKQERIIEAVKLVRESRKWTLKRSHDYVVAIRDKLRKENTK